MRPRLKKEKAEELNSEMERWEVFVSLSDEHI